MHSVHSRILLTLIFSGLYLFISAQTQHFSKFFSFGPSNPFGTASFVNCHELRDSSGFLILADQYTTTRSVMLIRTDTNVTEIWSTALNFQSATPPFDNINFIDVGEFPNGNYFILGSAGPGGTSPRYVIFVFDTSGQVINHVALHDAQNTTNTANYPQIHIGADSSIVLAYSEYERFGFYRLDQNLNVLSSGFYTDGGNSWGRDCIMLHDSSLVMTSANGLTKTTTAGTILWSKSYTFGSHIKCLYESPTGSLYAGGYGSTSASCATLARFDSTGNPVFVKNYNMAPLAATSAIWNIYACDDHLMLYSDSVLIVADTNGNVVGWGKTMNSYNYKILKPGIGDDFLVTGLIYQDSTTNYEYTIMKFDDSTSSGCLRPRALVTTPGTLTTTPAFPVVQNVSIVRDTIAFTSASVNVDYDPLRGCPPGPLAIDEITETSSGGVFPNPASDQVTFRFTPVDPSATVEVRVIDALGRVIAILQPTSSGTVTVSVSDWAEGLYVFVLCEDEIPVQRATFCVTR